MPTVAAKRVLPGNLYSAKYLDAPRANPLVAKTSLLAPLVSRTLISRACRTSILVHNLCASYR
jgi:hypothetical protein